MWVILHKTLSEQNPHDVPIIQRLLKTPEVERQPEFHVHIVVPNEFQPLEWYNIGITCRYRDNTMSTWLEGLNRMNLNIVPSILSRKPSKEVNMIRWMITQKQKVGEIKCDKPIEVLFEGPDTNIFAVTREFSQDLVDEFKTSRKIGVFV